jgi:hypothetical protein
MVKDDLRDRSKEDLLDLLAKLGIKSARSPLFLRLENFQEFLRRVQGDWKS